MHNDFQKAENRRRTGGGQCGECSSCGKCAKVLNRNNKEINTVDSPQHNILQTPPLEEADRGPSTNMEQDNSTQLYTFLIYSENVPGLLSQITAVFTRRQVNIESLNVCASSTPGAHKYTITAYCDEHMAQMLTRQMEKRIEVLQANYYTDDEIFINETALFKVSTPVLLQNRDVSRLVRIHSARFVEVNETYATIEKNGSTRDVLALYEALKETGCVLQFVRSGRICITKSTTERLDEYLAAREAKRKKA